MFQDGEFQIFRNADFHPVFYGDTLIGPRMPNMTYLLSFANMEEVNAKWDAFNSCVSALDSLPGAHLLHSKEDRY
jgi:hypothetical protein